MKYNALTQTISRGIIIVLIVIALVLNAGLLVIALIYLLSDILQFIISFSILRKKYFKPIPQFLKQKMALYRVFEGLKLAEESNGKEARIKFKEALKQDPKCAAAYYYLGHSYIQEERLEDAVKEWQSLCSKIPEKAHVVFDDLEKTWFELGNFAEAENLYNKILEENTDDIHAALALAEIYNKKGEYDRALEILQRYEDIYPDHPRVQAVADAHAFSD